MAEKALRTRKANTMKVVKTYKNGMPAVTSKYNEHYKRTYYTSHVYNSCNQEIIGGGEFPASDEKSCAYHGVPVIKEG